MADSDTFLILTAASPETCVWFRDERNFRSGSYSSVLSPLDDDGAAPPSFRVTFTGLFHALEIGTQFSKWKPAGVHFGTMDAWAHVLLPTTIDRSVSDRHYIIAVDKSYRVWLHDVGSKKGTAFECDGQNRDENQTWNRWIIAPPPGNNALFEDMVIHTGSVASIKIQLPNHTRRDPAYLGNLERFKRLTIGEGARLEAKRFDFKSMPPPAIGFPAPEGMRMPRAQDTVMGNFRPYTSFRFRHIYYRLRPLRQQNGHQFHLVVTDRGNKNEQYLVSKTLDSTHAAQASTQIYLESGGPKTVLQNEFDLLSECNHPSIMAPFAFEPSMPQWLALENHPFTTIDERKGWTPHELLHTFGMLLSAVAHLADRNIIHGDLKNSIFVVKEDLLEEPPRPSVMIGDMINARRADERGHAAAAGKPSKYTAPEFSDGQFCGLRSDVWALGMLMVEWIWGLGIPDSTDAAFALDWSSWVDMFSDLLGEHLERVAEQADHRFLTILQGMLDPDGRSRWTARQCLDYGLEEGLFEKPSALDETIVPAANVKI